MMSERTTLARLAALCLALAPLPVALAYSETDLATLEETGSCSGCDLAGADLYEADLFQANLLGADLREADLTAADLTLADLRGADLRGAILDETNLSGANLTAALLDKDALAGAIFDSERTRTTLGFKDLKLGMNVVEVAQYCSITNIDGKASDLANLITSKTNTLEGTCFDIADMPFAFKFSGGGTTGVLSFLKVGIAAYTEENHRKFIDLLAKKYEPVRSYTAADVATFNKDRSRKNQSLDTIFANGQVMLSVVSQGTGLQMLLSYRAEENGRRFLKRKGGVTPVDLTQLPAAATDLYRLAGNYRLTGISDSSLAIAGRIDTAYLEIDVFENELAGELVIDGFAGLRARLRIATLEEVTENWLRVKLEPVDARIPDGRPLEMVILFSKNGNSIVGEWTNWFILQSDGRRQADDFKGVRSHSFWQTVNEHNRIDMYQAYLRLRPGGIYSAAARSRITALGGTLPVPSAPTVSVAATASPSTPTTTATTATAVDPRVGVWKFCPGCPGLGSLWGYFIEGMDDQGGLAGFQWQNIESQTFGLREITIESLSDGSYSWHSDQSVSLVNPSFAMGDAADGGKFWVSENENGLPTVTSSKELFLQWRGLPPRQTLQKIALEDALALDIPAQLPKDFPSPLQNGTSNAVLFDKQENVLPASEEPIQIAKATSASTRGSENPALKSATSKPAKENLDPIVGIWVALDGVWGASDRCFAFIGRAADGTLIGKSWEEHDHAKPKGNEPYADLNIFSLRELEISPTEPGIFKWRADRSLAPQIDGIPSWLGAPQSGVFSLKQKGSDGYVLTSRDRLCRKSQHDLSATSFQKLSYDEVFALDLPQEILDGLPKPSGEEAQWNSSAVPVPKDSETSSATSAGKTERR